MSGVTAESTLLLHFTSRRPDGEIFEDTRSGKPVLVTLGKKQINPAFEEALIGKSEGETVTVDGNLDKVSFRSRYEHNASRPLLPFGNTSADIPCISAFACIVPRIGAYSCAICRKCGKFSYTRGGAL